MSLMTKEQYEDWINRLDSEDMTDRIVFLEKGEKVVDENEEVLYESK